MLSLLYDIFISPLIMGMNFVLVNAYSILHSYGLAIVVLSLVVNTVLLPLYHMADKWQQEEREKQNKMADKVAEIKQAFQGQERFMMLKTLYRQNHYHPIMAVRNSVGFLIQVPFFFAAYQLLSHFPELNGQSFGPFANLGLPDGLLTIGDLHINVMPFVMTGINLLSAFVYTKGLSSKDKIQLYVFAGIFLVLLYTSPVGLVLYWTLNNVYSLGKNIVTSYINNDLVTNVKLKSFKYISPSLVIYLLSISYVFILVFVYVDINFYISDSSFFDNDISFYSLKLFVLYCQTILIAIMIYISFSNVFKSILTWLSFFILTLSTCYILFPIVNYGHVDNYFIANVSGLSNRLVKAKYDVLIYILSFFISVIILNKVKVKNITNMLLLIIVSVLTYIFFLSQTYTKVGEYKSEIKSNITPITPGYSEDFNSYSKDEKNIVVIMLDMFTGDHVEEIFSKYPDIKNDFTGFVNYPDTIASGNNTYYGEPSILGGDNSKPRNINDNIEGDLVPDVIAKNYKPLVNTFNDNNYDVSILGLQNTKCEKINNYSSGLAFCKGISYEKDYSRMFLKERNIQINSVGHVNQFKFMLAYSAFSVAPYSLKKSIYDDASWLGVVSKQYSYDKVAPYAFISLMSNISNTKSKKSTLKYIQSSVTHGPWAITKSLDVSPNQIGFDQRKNERGYYPAHFYSEAYSLKEIGEWLRWLKVNDIYNNTMVILVSDHSAADSIGLYKTFGVNTFSGKNSFDTYKIETKTDDLMRINALLMIKDFNDNENFKTSDKYMSNSDVSKIICSAIGSCPEIGADPRLNNKDRIRTFDTGELIHPKYDKYYIKDSFNIKGSIFDKDSWSKVK
ncbi:hypothetical protein C9J20_20670 [Photobacterium phosphoreum]|uniref:YidC/Oxa1 family membrane protein insertase n=1 Tax=Photobacterium phosphoreum TaxID=659 RepID=UPI000D158258|nr:YidC/Oxa1 family membrane protein insertase [Photobacterium phosphoreum]PSU64876.1 hypothetical protein CTM79_20145 [Photobacterium phosphoreum]PSW06398.1 hypothetical protein C9J20_20670 [Photobacterium phosphoreum]